MKTHATYTLLGLAALSLAAPASARVIKVGEGGNVHYDNVSAYVPIENDTTDLYLTLGFDSNSYGHVQIQPVLNSPPDGLNSLPPGETANIYFTDDRVTPGLFFSPVTDSFDIYVYPDSTVPNFYGDPTNNQPFSVTFEGTYDQDPTGNDVGSVIDGTIVVDKNHNISIRPNGTPAAAVPEPTSGALLGVGVLPLVLALRARRQKQSERDQVPGRLKRDAPTQNAS